MSRIYRTAHTRTISTAPLSRPAGDHTREGMHDNVSLNFFLLIFSNADDETVMYSTVYD